MTSEKLRVLVVDDEPLARDNLRIALSQVDQVNVVGECGDGAAAIEAIERLDPDVVMLDVQMPGIDGFGVIDEVGVEQMPTVVFVTAFDAHAVRAFQVHAFDYILKPFDDARLREVMQRVHDHRAERRDGQRARQLAALLSEWTGTNGDGLPARPAASVSPSYVTRLTVRTGDRIRYVSCTDVEYFEAEGNYIGVHAKGETHRIRFAIGALADQLDPSMFVRIHRSTIVNMNRIREVQPWFGGDYIAIMASGAKLRVSRARASALVRPTL